MSKRKYACMTRYCAAHYETWMGLRDHYTRHPDHAGMSGDANAASQPTLQERVAGVNQNKTPPPTEPREMRVDAPYEPATRRVATRSAFVCALCGQPPSRYGGTQDCPDPRAFYNGHAYRIQPDNSQSEL